MTLKEKMIKLKLSPRKETSKIILIILLLILLGFTCSFLLSSWLYISISLCIAVIFTYLSINKYDVELSKIEKENLEEFVNLFSFFRIYIKNGYNVFTALKEIANFANQNLKELLDQLIETIDKDKSVKPFISFAHNFQDIIVEEMMISVYQMIDDGEQSNYLHQFELIFDKFADLIVEKNLKSKDSSLGSLSSAPLVGSCFLIIMITVGIIGILGDMLNVL